MANEVTKSDQFVAVRGNSGPIAATIVFLARVGGLILLAVGIVTMTRVAYEAWTLYQEPANISRFAEAVERGSNIDKLLVPGNRRSGTAEPTYSATGGDLKPSYFLAWTVAIPLLLTIGLLALWAIRAGAELTVYGWLQPRPKR